MPASPPYRSKWDAVDEDEERRRRRDRPESSRSSHRDRRGDEGWRHDRGAAGSSRDDLGPRRDGRSHGDRSGSGRYEDESRYRDRENGSHGAKGRPRSRSPRPSSSSRPDFVADRARERRAYESNARRGEGPGPSGGGRVGGAPSEEPPVVEEEAVNFEPSGLLAKESNQKDGVALKYHEPPEARKPRLKWRLYVFKDGKEEELLHISRQSCYLLGRDRTVVDIPLDHPSCSKQHAVLQYRQVVERNEFGDEKRSIRPFIIDLESANGTYVNKDEIPTSRFYELKNGDTMAFGASNREYVLLCEDE